MKKILTVLILVVLSTGLVLPVFAQAPNECLMKTDAGIPDNCPDAGNACKYDKYYRNGSVVTGTVQADDVSGATCCLLNTISNATNWLSMIIMLLAALLIMYGGFTLITGGGAEDKVKAGRDYIMYALMGVFIALIARAIPYFVRTIVGA